VLADGVVRYRGEAVAGLLGERTALEAVRADELPIRYKPLPAVTGVEAASAAGAPLVQADRPGNFLVEGVVRSGDGEAALAGCAALAEGEFTTAFVEHAYIEPEAGWAQRAGDLIEVHVTTQSPYLDRNETARVLGIAPERVRILPTACGGGFGGKLDLSVQPLLAVAASLVDRPVALVYERPESMASSTKRHPARIRARLGCDADGRLRAFAASADFDTGAYSSWGPTVAGRVPVHAMGPYRVPHVAIRARALFTNGPPSGAFRGFGVPQAAIAHEALMDDLALRLGIDRLQFRLRNALRAGDRTATGQRLEASVGLAACLKALAPRWQGLLGTVDGFNSSVRKQRQGVGIGCMWYGIGNTALPHPSRIRLGLTRTGRLILFSGAVDIGQGANTILSQIAADALGVPVERIDLVTGDTDRTADAGKTSASRQTFVSGKATELAARELRAELLRRANAGADATLALADGVVLVREAGRERRLELAGLEADADGIVLLAEGHFDPPSAPLDRDGQGSPYPTYAFAAQVAQVQVDLELGTTKVLEIVAAHDVGRAINPTQVEGQIEGGIAQGLGMALMEEYLPGRTENLHDYLIPTFGDMPRIEVMLIEDPEPLGPFGAKGVGEPGLIPTAPAILGAIRHATGVRLTQVPALPHRLRAAILARDGDG
jgi:aldehyde oxidoreductase